MRHVHTAVALGLLSSLATTQGWLTTPREVLPDVGDGIRSFADFDGDGHLDLVVSRARVNLSGIAHWSVLWGTGDGDFVAGPTMPAFPTGYQGDEYMLAGDVTGDGRPDVVTSLRELSGAPGSGFLLYRNLGGRAFGDPRHTPAGVPWANGALSDWDGDGVYELVAVYVGSGTSIVQRWTYQGGTFVGSNALTTPEYIEHVAIGEVTGDAWPDVVAGASESNRIYVSPTLPGGGLGAMTAYTVGGPARFRSPIPECGDYDGDGDDDVVVGWASGTLSSSLAIVTHDGAGGLAVGPALTFGIDPGGYWSGRPHLADWDGDGDGDVLLSYEDLYLLENRGAGGLQVASSMRVGQSRPPLGVQDGNEGVGAADFDGDGYLDFAGGRAVAHGTGTFDNGSFGAIVSSVQQPLDYDGDGDVDILESGATLRVNRGRNVFVDRELMPPLAAPFFYSEAHACGDFTGNGHLDFLVTKFENIFIRYTVFVEMRLLEGSAHGELVDRGPAGPPAEEIGDSWSFKLVQADLDGDGDIDVAVDDGWWENGGSGFFGTFHAAWVGRPIMLADVDANGTVDVLTRTVSAAATTYQLERNQGGSFASEVLASEASNGAFAEPALVDLDGDGDLDFAVGLANGPAVSLRENQGGVFGAARTLASRDRAFEWLTVDDFDGDSRLDLAALPATSSGPFGDAALLWRGTGPGLAYSAPRAYFAQSVVVGQGDLDGDGDPDTYGRYGRVAGSGRYAGADAGSFSQYGAAEPGPSGIPPLLGVRGPLRAGGSMELRLRAGQGAGAALLVIGIAPAALPNQPLPGLTLRVSPIALSVPVALRGPSGVPGAGAADLSLQVPLGVGGVRLFQQAFFLDGAGVGASNGLEIAFGQ